MIYITCAFVSTETTGIKNYYYLAGCTMFPHLPAPVWQLYYLLPPVTSVIPVVFHQSFFPTSPLIPSAQVRLGLPRFLLPGGRYFITSFGNLPSSNLETCPYRMYVYIGFKTFFYIVRHPDSIAPYLPHWPPFTTGIKSAETKFKTAPQYYLSFFTAYQI